VRSQVTDSESSTMSVDDIETEQVDLDEQNVILIKNPQITEHTHIRLTIFWILQSFHE
jgi:hypothetical protein